MEIDLPGGSKYTNLGEWLHSFTYAVFDDGNLKLKKFEG